MKYMPANPRQNIFAAAIGAVIDAEKSVPLDDRLSWVELIGALEVMKSELERELRNAVLSNQEHP